MDSNNIIRGQFTFSETVDNPNILTNFTMVQRTAQGTLAFPWNFEIISEEIQSKMFSNGQYGSDLIAMDVMRSRDCCLKPYIHYLDLFQGKCVNSWANLRAFLPIFAVDQLQLIFKDPKDIDLYTGGSVEIKDPDPQVRMPPTFKRISVEQYKLLKNGDPKFWNRITTAAQRALIKQLSFGDLLCIAFKLTMVPQDAKMAWSGANPLVKCRCTKLEDCFDIRAFFGTRCV